MHGICGMHPETSARLPHVAPPPEAAQAPAAEAAPVTAAGPRGARWLDGALPLLALLFVFALGFTVLQPFLPAILWGVILSVALGPLHARLASALGGRRMAATWAVTLLMVLALLLPAIGLSRALVAFMPDMIDWIATPGAAEAAAGVAGDAAPRVLAFEATTAWNALLADLATIREHFGEELRPVAFWLISEGKLVGVFVAEFALGLLLAALLMHHAGPMGVMIRAAARRIGGALALEMTDLATATVRSTVLGVLGSAAVQTAAAVLAYAFVDAPHWPILALVTFLLAMVQIGPVLVWGPLTLWLWTEGRAAEALFMAAWGGLVVGMADNVVRTLVLSRRTRLPAILGFLGALGGLLVWGLVGLFVGPVVIAVCHRLLMTWAEHERRRETPARPSAPDEGG
jgi:predicted PurR-regulated permease PerM